MARILPSSGAILVRGNIHRPHGLITHFVLGSLSSTTGVVCDGKFGGGAHLGHRATLLVGSQITLCRTSFRECRGNAKHMPKSSG